MTAERWKKLIEHVRDKVEDHYWEKDDLYEERTCTLESEDDDSSGSSDDSGSDSDD